MNRHWTYPLLLVATLSCGCTSKIHTAAVKAAFDYQGHRGARGLMPENTIPAMLRAIEEGVTTLEMDVVITSDSQVILSHEPWMNSDITTKSDGTFIKSEEAQGYNIYKMTYAETLLYDVGMKPHPRFTGQQKIKVHKPLLKDVLTAVDSFTASRGKSPMHFNIETKTTPFTDEIFHPRPDAFVTLLVEVLATQGKDARTTIQSFDVRTLQFLHGAHPHIKTALLVDEGDKRSVAENLAALGFTPSVYSPYYKLVTPELVAACKAAGMKLSPWTVNTLTEMAALKNSGVDGIISDYPNLFNKLPGHPSGNDPVDNK
jgi:glycerophosphoryl diester phosphodiesterase